MSAYCRRAVAQAVALRGRARRHGHGHHARSAVGRGHAARGDRVGHRSRRRRPRRPRLAIRRSPVPTPSPPRGRSPPRSTGSAGSTSCSPGRNSVDADTGQVGPELAELLGLPFVTGARHLTLDGPHARHPRRARRRMGAGPGRPARRSCRPPSGSSTRARWTRPGRAAVPADRIAPCRAPPTSARARGAPPPARPASARRASSTSARLGRSTADRPLDRADRARGRAPRASAAPSTPATTATPTAARSRHRSAASRSTIGVVVEPDRAGLTRELLGAARRARRRRWSR